MEEHRVSESGRDLESIPVWFIKQEIAKTLNCFGVAKYCESLQLLLMNWYDRGDTVARGAYKKWN